MDGLHYLASRGMLGFGCGTVVAAYLLVPDFSEWAMWTILGSTWIMIALMMSWRP